MYEFISGFERWKNFDKNYNEKYHMIKSYTEDCKKQCLDDENCKDLCRKPIVDIERFNLNMIKKLTVDVYEVCSNKFNSNEANLEFSKMKSCLDNLYEENETYIKKQTLERMDDMINFLNIKK